MCVIVKNRFIEEQQLKILLSSLGSKATLVKNQIFDDINRLGWNVNVRFF